MHKQKLSNWSATWFQQKNSCVFKSPTPGDGNNIYCFSQLSKHQLDIYGLFPCYHRHISVYVTKIFPYISKVSKIDYYRFVMCLLQAPVFQGFFFLWTLTVLMKQTRQAVCTVNQSIFLRYQLIFIIIALQRVLLFWCLLLLWPRSLKQKCIQRANSPPSVLAGRVSHSSPGDRRVP